MNIHAQNLRQLAADYEKGITGERKILEEAALEIERLEKLEELRKPRMLTEEEAAKIPSCNGFIKE